MLKSTLFVLALVAGLTWSYPFDLYQFAADIAEFPGLGPQYFNVNGSCTFPSDLSMVPQISVNTAQDLINLATLRARYPPNQLVYIQLTAADSEAGPAYLLSQQVNLFQNMSCSYIRGLGLGTTSVLVDYPAGPASPLGYALYGLAVYDVIIVDLTIDRTNSSFWNPGYQCSTGQLASNSTVCVGFAKTFNSLWFQDISRVHFSRIQTWGGFYFDGGGNSTISSSFVNSVLNTLVFSKDTLSGNEQEPFGLSSGFIIYNNTISSPFNTGIDVYYVLGFWIHHNYIYDCGYSPASIGWSADVLFEYNIAHNYSFINGAGGGAAGVYLYGGWAVWGYHIINNWFSSPSQKCFYWDGITSNVVFEYNVCYVSSNEVNGGRYNILRNNLFFALKTGNSGSHLGDLNCPLMDGNNFTPFSTVSCFNTIGRYINSGYSRYALQNVWSNLDPNGTVNSPPTPQILAYLNHLPNLNYSIFCAPLTAGPNNAACATNKTTYYSPSNNFTYPFPCEILPSNNRLGSTDYVGFTVIYNASATGGWNPGFGCGPCNGQTGACPFPPVNSSWGPWVYDASQLLSELNWMNSSFYSWKQYNSINSSMLFGAVLNFSDPTFFLTPQTYVLTPNSQLGQDNPALLNIDVPHMGLLPYVPIIYPSGTPTTPTTASPNPSTAQTASPNPTAVTNNSGSNQAGLIAGVVIGVVVFLALVGLIIFFALRRRQHTKL